MDVRQTLLELEQRLLSDEIRHDAQELSSLLADEFREFGSSGRIFSKTEIIDLLLSESSVGRSLTNLDAYPVSEHAVLVTFRAVREVAGSPPLESLRSSLWVHRDGRWQLLFHQGTKVPHESQCAR
jgi:hypothetical protein